MTFRMIVLAAFGAAFSLQTAAAQPGLPTEVTDFGANPGNLKMYKYIPSDIRTPAPLVVVMHGCTEDAVSYTRDTGWIAVADMLHVALVMPDAGSHTNKCFDWFDSSSNQRDQGDALSIRNMIEKMKSDHGIDSRHIYATGLSAGGAMTSVMLAVYPEVFAGGGIVAGLPYGCANNLVEALGCMNNGRPFGNPAIRLSLSFSEDRALPSGQADAAAPQPRGGELSFSITLTPAAPAEAPKTFGQIRELPLGGAYCNFFPQLCPPTTPINWTDRLPPYKGARPKVSIWHGTADTTVVPVNAENIRLQWLGAHGLDKESGVTDPSSQYPHETYKNADGVAVVETYSITGMPHAQPVNPGPAPGQCGATEQYILDKGVCASYKIAKFWGLDGGQILGLGR